MILSGKCADRFKEWRLNKGIPLPKTLTESMLYALILEFMDSEGIYIYAKKESVWHANDWWFEVDLRFENHSMYNFPSRTEALKAAIEKANYLINTKNQ